MASVCFFCRRLRRRKYTRTHTRARKASDPITIPAMAPDGRSDVPALLFASAVLVTYIVLYFGVAEDDFDATPVSPAGIALVDGRVVIIWVVAMLEAVIVDATDTMVLSDIVESGLRSESAPWIVRLALCQLLLLHSHSNGSKKGTS